MTRSPGLYPMQLGNLAGGRGEAHGHLLRQNLAEVYGQIDMVQGIVDSEVDCQQFCPIVVVHRGIVNGGSGTVRYELRRRNRVRGHHRLDGVDIDADVLGVGRTLVPLLVIEGIELNGHGTTVTSQGVVAVAVEEAEAPAGGAQCHRFVMGEEEDHPVARRKLTAPLVNRDLEGEVGGEASQLAGGVVPERHRPGLTLSVINFR
ncbi:hypothetical protein GUJ93_ZPchr0002g23538 [Zizania palustris]|uniref:Uncharacterized protein n=1 Tax=Zizania palustris TaxID=103762 RepID=A0A8J5VQR0_ZIZPA|nr:hypothetical protein GUJ93_ZPchr0002g23538 [Zizania palustris]